MEEKLIQTLKRHQMILSGDRALVAVSGGVDSVVLLNLLDALGKEMGFEVLVAHFDHQMRDDSHEDAQFVKELAKSLELECVVGSESVPDFIEQTKRSPEDAARELRYRFLRETASQQNCNVIALGHHLDDRAETFLINLLRGSGLEGLSGMPAVRTENELRFVRPLIDCTANEIRTFALENGICFRDDPTNDELVYMRNRIRQRLIPLLRELNPNLEETISRTSELLREHQTFIDPFYERAYQDVWVESCDAIIKLNRLKFLDLEPVLARQALRMAIQELKGDLKGIELAHINRAMAEIRKHQSGIKVPLIGDFKIFIDSDEICVTSNEALREPAELGDFELDPRRKDPQISSELGWGFELEITDSEPQISDNPLEAAFDFDKIDGSLVVRTRRDGDRMTPLGMSGRKKIQDLLVDAKIPQRERYRVPLLCDNSGIIWVVQVRMEDRCRLTPDTKRVLKVRAFEIAEE